MTAAETARTALEIMDRDGWNKGAITMSHLSDTYRMGSHCAGGAWNLANHQDHDWKMRETDYLAPLADLIRAEYPEFHPYLVIGIDERIRIIAAWNNHPETTEEDVRRLLEKIASG